MSYHTVYHIGKIQKRLRRKSIHIGWYCCAILIAILVIASQHGDVITKMLMGG